MRTRVKICGFTRPEDARTAAILGVDAMGLVFYPASPRNVTLDLARQIAAMLPPFVTLVGLFVDARPEVVLGVAQRLPLDLLQFHGNEPPDYCRQFGRPYLKALRMRPELDLHAAAQAYWDARGLLLDAYHPDRPGGTGQRFDWSQVPLDLPLPLVLAGGLNAENVQSALRAVRPYAVDVSSGVESARGVKDARKIEAFLRNVRDYDGCS